MVKYKSKSQRRQQKRINRVSVNSTCEHSDNTDNIFLATTHAEKKEMMSSLILIQKDLCMTPLSLVFLSVRALGMAKEVDKSTKNATGNQPKLCQK
jgi:hypothetical protein